MKFYLKCLYITLQYNKVNSRFLFAFPSIASSVFYLSELALCADPVSRSFTDYGNSLPLRHPSVGRSDQPTGASPVAQWSDWQNTSDLRICKPLKYGSLDK